jgi:hypothetical protein
MGNRPAQVPSAGRGNVNRGNINRGNINTGNINRGNINRGDWNGDINIDNDWDGDWDWGDNGCCWGVGAGIVAGATAAAVASTYDYGDVVYALPPACGTTVVNGISYYTCDGTWYQPQFVGQSVEYVVVAPPQ